MVKEHEKNREQDSRQHQELVTLKTRLAELNRQTMERGFIVQRELAHERQVFDRELMVQRREMAQAHDNTNREIAQMQIAAQSKGGKGGGSNEKLRWPSGMEAIFDLRFPIFWPHGNSDFRFGFLTASLISIFDFLYSEIDSIHDDHNRQNY